ncbi:serine--tRNA ligase [Pseudoxanthobacter sp.]|uniref:serine--tRNA ligase n=1 Tax=Pseudoxanthobacter sp. TaxID=1925742 RepID=UPI002FE242AB
MLDIRWIRENPEALDRALLSRGEAAQSAALIALDDRRRKITSDLQLLQEQRNAASKEVGKAKAAGDEARAAALMAEVALLKERLPADEAALREAETAIGDALARVPNVPLAEVPVGRDESDNVELRKVGTKPSFGFVPRQHFELGEALGLMDFDIAAKITGTRFVVLRGALARLERALAQFMLDLHTGEHGYTEVNPPLMVRDETMFGTAQLPKFADDQFRTMDGRWLIPTAEVPLTNLVREQILDEAVLPLRMAAFTQCFRLEAGAAGRDTRGMLRQHQFGKVELVSVTTPETSQAEQERLVGCAEEVLKRLGLHYRVVVLCTGDMGFGAARTYDIEVWLPGQDTYREISSCSVCGDFQARRMSARYRSAESKSPRYVHTLNGSGVAVGRALIAVMENYQNEDGSVTVPEALRPYMGGVERIAAA